MLSTNLSNHTHEISNGDFIDEPHNKNDCFYDDESMTRENNHTVCSWRYQSSEYLDPSIVKANTSCVEQINKVLQTKKARSIQWMSLPVAVMYFSLFLTMHNINETWCKHKFLFHHKANII